ncbi:MAG: glycosyltransferase [Gammaproteobacteria bacterium]|nr:glycosyltransferase [Gammaproteobacteria bacterium]
MEQRDKPGLLVLTTTFPRWAGDHEPPFVYELSRRLGDDFDITVLAPHAPGAQKDEIMDGIRVRRFRYAPDRLEKLAYDGGIPTRLRLYPWLALLLPSFLLAQIGAALQLVRERNPAVIHAHWLLPGGLIGAIARELLPGRHRLLITAHGADVHLRDRWPVRALKRLAVESADAVTVVSHAMKERVQPLVPEGTRVEVASMGVDLQTRFVPAAQRCEAERLAFVGRLVEKKGAADLLEALALVRERHPGVQLVLAGHGPLEKDLRALTARLGLEQAVEFRGSIPNHRLPEVFQRARIAVLPFRTAEDGDTEGLGLVAVEAMGCGIPVIVGDVPAIHDVVAHAETGWLVPARDPAALAEAIMHLLEDPLLADRLGTNGRHHAMRNFDWSVVARRYRDILNALSG